MPFSWGRAQDAQERQEVEVQVAQTQEVRDKQARENVWTRDSDLMGKLKAQEAERKTWWSTFFLAYGSLGVIYGDIGTSIIYVYAQIFVTVGAITDDPDGDKGLEDSVLSAMSLIFWTLTLIALVKYVFVVLRANDTGEGGTVALYAQLCRVMGISPFGTMRMQDHQQVLALTRAASWITKRPNLGEHRHRNASSRILNGGDGSAPLQREDSVRPEDSKSGVLPIFKPWYPPFGFAVLEGLHVIRWFRRKRLAQRALLLVTMVATGLVIGDGVLMPAFSVNSAISGIEQHTSGDINSAAIVGISVAIIVLLFVSQHYGTQKIAFLFSPIICLWLAANLGIAIYNLHVYGGTVFRGLNPYYIYVFFHKFKRQGWEMLGGVMLCVSGTETMFAAMGHFSQGAVALAFGCFAYPCLVLSYLGQGAYLLQNPQDSHITFWAAIPDPIFWPMLVLATLAAIVASQAVITGTFSIIRQATALGVFPKLRIVHTDSFVEGQIFIPSINYILMLLCIAVIAGFGGDNDRLGDAYGVAVMAVMLVTTCMVSLIMLMKWDVSLLVVIPFFLLFLCIEGVFLSANLFKVPSGGWFPLAVAACVCLAMTVWWLGQYFRRKMMLRTSKEQDASKFFMIYNGEAPPDPSHHDHSEAFLALRSAYGSAADLSDNAPNLTAAGYVNHDSPPRPALLRAATGPLKPGPGSSLVSGSGSGPGQTNRPSAPASLTLARVSASPATLRPHGRGGSVDGSRSVEGVDGSRSVDGVDGVEGAPVSLSEVEVRTGSGTNRVRFATADNGYGRTSGPPFGSLHGSGAGAASFNGEALSPRLNGGGGGGGSPNRFGPGTSPASTRRNSLIYTKTSITPIELPPRPTMALVSRPFKPLAKLSGLGLYYSESPHGVPLVMKHFLRNADALHEAGILLTVRFLPMPTIKNAERFLVRAVNGLPNFYQVVARYGYQDTVDHSEKFVQQIITTIVHKLELKAGLMYEGLENDFIHELEGDYVEDEAVPHVQADAGSRVFGLEIVHETYIEEEEEELAAVEAEVPASPFVSRFALTAMARIRVVASAPDAAPAALEALGAARALVETANERVVYYLGRGSTRSASMRSLMHSITIGGLYRVLEMFSYQDSEAWLIPVGNMVELGVALEV